MITRRLLVRIVTEIKKIMDEKDVSSRELEDMCKKNGFPTVTRSKILRAFYVGNGKQFFLNSTDTTIEAVLTSLGYTGDDVIDRIVKTDNHVEVSCNVSNEIREFVQNQEAVPYLKMAYTQFKLNQAKIEFEKIRNEMQEQIRIDV